MDNPETGATLGRTFGDLLYMAHLLLLLFFSRHRKLSAALFINRKSDVHNILKLQINTTGATSGAGTAYPSGAPEFTPGFQWGSCYPIYSFMCMCCRSLFVLLCFSCGHCVVCSYSIYGFRLLRWHLQTLLSMSECVIVAQRQMRLFSAT